MRPIGRLWSSLSLVSCALSAVTSPAQPSYVIVDDVAYMPVRELAAVLGLEVTYDHGDGDVTLTLGDSALWMDGETQLLYDPHRGEKVAERYRSWTDEWFRQAFTLLEGQAKDDAVRARIEEAREEFAAVLLQPDGLRDQLGPDHPVRRRALDSMRSLEMQLVGYVDDDPLGLDRVLRDPVLSVALPPLGWPRAYWAGPQSDEGRAYLWKPPPAMSLRDHPPPVSQIRWAAEHYALLVQNLDRATLDGIGKDVLARLTKDYDSLVAATGRAQPAPTANSLKLAILAMDMTLSDRWGSRYWKFLGRRGSEAERVTLVTDLLALLTQGPACGEELAVLLSGQQCIRHKGAIYGPVRSIAEHFGRSVKFDVATQTVRIGPPPARPQR